jgi:Transposase DDE domain
MPEPIWTYLTALLYFTEVSTCLAIAQALENASHDRLTRMLKGRWSGQTLLDVALRALFTVMGGELIIDDTIVEKPYAAVLEEAAWVWSTKQNQVVFGIPVVLLVWTNGQVRIPLACRIWQKGGPSKFDLALELLSYARNRLRVKPRFVLFDAWYPSKPVLKRLRDYGWYFVCQVKKNRLFEGKPLRDYQRQPYWQAVGKLSGGIKVRVVKYRRKYYATNRLSLTAQEVRASYKRRHAIEEVFRFLKDQLSLAACQAGYTRLSKEKSQVEEGVQAHHIALCLVAYLILERERIKHGITLRQLRRKLIVRGLKVSLPSLKRVRMAA